MHKKWYLFNFINLKRYIAFKRVDGYNFKQHLNMIFVFFAMSVATTIYTNLDTAMLGFMKTDTDVGYYNAAVKIKSILVSIVTSLGTVLLPRASYYVEHKNYEQFYRITRKAINFIFVIALPLCLYFIIFAKEGIYFLSGDAYNGSVLPMQIIMPTLLFIGLTNIIGIQMMIPLGKEKQVLYSEIAGAITDLILNIILIPRFSSAGAAIGTLAAEIIVFIWQFGVMFKEIKKAFYSIKYYLIIIATIGASSISVICKNINTNYFMMLLISGFCFFSVYGIILIIGKEPFIIEIKKQITKKFK